jgi:hypothetical protein
LNKAVIMMLMTEKRRAENSETNHIQRFQNERSQEEGHREQNGPPR